jgi:hypothetical protein
MSLRIQVDGVGLVEVDPSFQNLSPQEQESFIGEIKQSVAGGRMTSDMTADTPASTPIDAPLSSFDLDAAIPDSPPAVTQSATPQQSADPNALAGTPFDYQRASSVLDQFVADTMDKQNLVRGAKYGDKADIEEDWMNTRDQIYAPEFEKLGINPARAQIAATQVADGKARNMFEALGIPEPQNNAPAVRLSPEQVKEATGLQNFIQNNINLANETEDPRQKRDYQRLASEATQKLRAMSGAPEPSPYERYENIRGVLEELGRKKDRGGLGTVEYDGVAYPVAGAAALESDLAMEQADLLDRLATDPEARASIRVSLRNAQVPKMDKNGKPLLGQDGNPILDKEATTARYAELIATAKPGEIVEQEDGSIGPFMGIKKDKQSGDWTPKGLKPAIKGAAIIGEDITEAVAPYMTKENMARASALAGSVVPTLGAPVQAVISMTDDGGAKLKKGATTAMKTALAGGLSGGVWGQNYLAALGLEYLSSVGRRAQEEEEKKRAGQ